MMAQAGGRDMGDLLMTTMETLNLLKDLVSHVSQPTLPCDLQKLTSLFPRDVFNLFQ